MVASKAMQTLFAFIDPVANFNAIKDAILVTLRHRALCWEWSRRELGGQFASQAFGNFWIIGHPLLLLGIYTFVFAIVLKVRIATSVEMPRDYTTYLLAGLVPWLSIVQTLGRASNALLGQSNIVKQVVFPIEVLPAATLIISLIPLAVGIALILARNLLVEGSLSLAVLLLPVALGIHIAFMLGLAYLLAAVTPFFRDLKDIIVIFTIAGVYLIPAFFLPQWLPPLFKPIVYCNPFSYLIWIYQDILYYGAIRHEFAWIFASVLALFFLATGYRTFRALKPYVANVL